MNYRFLTDTYETEIEKVVSVWSQFEEADLTRRPRPGDPRGRNPLEHMVHQSLSEDLWFKTILGIQVTETPLPERETRLDFIRHYVENARRRLAALRAKPEVWWEEETQFFDVRRTRAWVMTRRLTHTAHHRGQQTALLRMLGRSLHSTYGPSADTGGLMQQHAPTLYPYPDLETLIREEAGSRRKNPLPGPGNKPVTERPAEN